MKPKKSRVHGMALSVLICLNSNKPLQAQTDNRTNFYSPSTFTKKSIQTWQTFNAANKNRWNVEWNKNTGTPHLIYGHQIAIPESLRQETIEQITRQVLNKHKDLLQIDLNALVLSTAGYTAPKFAGRSSGTWRVYYHQQYRGIPVYGGSVRMIIRNNKVTSFGSDYYPGIEISPDPRITKEEAALIASNHAEAKSPLKPLDSKLVIFPSALNGLVKYYLAWQITMPSTYLSKALVEGRKTLPDTSAGKKQLIPVQWQYFIDAIEGGIIKRINVENYDELNGNVSGTIHFSNPTNPVIQNIPHITVTLAKDGMNLETVTDAGGNYQFVTSSPGIATLEAHLVGPHVRIHNESTPDPDATYNAPLTISGTTTHDWNWTMHDFSPNYIETNAFYHVNFIHDWYTRGGPFDITPEPYPMDVYLLDLERWDDIRSCNGKSGTYGLSFPVPDYTCPDFSLCSDIVYHEFTHRIVHKIYNDSGIPSSEYYYSMHEGWGDYFASTITGNPYHGGGCYIGRHIDVPDKRFPEDFDLLRDDIHTNGMILSGAIWDTRNVLGADYTDGLAILSMKDAATSYSGYLGAMLENDDDPSYSPDDVDANPANGTPNIEVIAHSFYDLHGIYHRYIIGHTEKPVAAILSPDLIQYEYFSNKIYIIGSANGSKTNPMVNFIIEYARKAPPIIWSTVGVTLTRGGTSPVTEATLGTIDITGFPHGLDSYLIRLTVTDAGGVRNSFTTRALIRQLLASGWPQNLSERYRNSAAVADIDPSVSGLEIVASTYTSVFVYHADGSLYAPWPKHTEDDMLSAPAVADLDNDGRQEIVVSDRSYLTVWRHDGTLVFHFSYGGRGSLENILPSPVVADLDNDGDMEIIAAGSMGSVFIVHHDGTAFSYGGFTWPKTIVGFIFQTPAIADLDHDFQKEIVFGCSAGKVYAWKLNGTNVAGSWPLTIGASTHSSPAIGDIDNDALHDLEIVMGADDGRVYAWHHDGSAVSGSWPVLIPYPNPTHIEASPALADLDHNGDLEIIINRPYGSMKALEHDGSNVTNWNPDPLLLFDGNSPVAGSLDWLNLPDIVAGSVDGRLCAFHSDGNTVNDFPRETAAGFFSGTPLITDLNQDGHSEIIAGSMGLYVWTLPGSYNGSIQPWPTFHHDMRRTGYYGSESGLAKIDKLRKSYRFALSLHSGTSIPLKQMADSYSSAINGSVGFDYRKYSQVFLSILFSTNYFFAKNASPKDMVIMTLSPRVKTNRVFNGLFYVYAGGGPEAMIVRDAGTKLGLTAELGIGMPITYTLNIELGARYHTTSARDYEFLTANLGLLFKL